MSTSANYKGRIYDNYYKTHILPRTGAITLQQLNRELKIFDHQFGVLLPADRDARILDAGCGYGNVVYWLQQRGYTQCHGIDGSPDHIAAGQALGIANLEIGDLVSHLAARAGTFDLIIMRDVLEHFAKPEVLETLELCFNALKPGGRLILQMPNGASPLVGRILYGDFTHETAYTETSLSQLFSVIGFVNHKFKPYLRYTQLSWRSPFSSSGRLALAKWAVWTAAKTLYDLLLFAEIGPHKTITTYNLIASAARPNVQSIASRRDLSSREGVAPLTL